MKTVHEMTFDDIQNIPSYKIFNVVETCIGNKPSAISFDIEIVDGVYKGSHMMLTNSNLYRDNKDFRLSYKKVFYKGCKASAFLYDSDFKKICGNIILKNISLWS